MFGCALTVFCKNAYLVSFFGKLHKTVVLQFFVRNRTVSLNYEYSAAENTV